MVGSHPLWGHYLYAIRPQVHVVAIGLNFDGLRWNAARCFADYLDQNAEQLCKDKDILELGAGGALPSLVCTLNGGHSVRINDSFHVTQFVAYHNLPRLLSRTIRTMSFWTIFPTMLQQRKLLSHREREVANLRESATLARGE